MTQARTSQTRENKTGAPGLIVAAPASGSGKTVVTLGLMRALADRGLRVAPAKTGPDYIDPAFHAAACGRPSINLDPWAMRAGLIDGLAGALGAEADIVLTEGVMGLFDGAADGTGSTADLAARTGWPVLLVVDVKGQAASSAAVVRGFATHRPDIAIAGVIFNRVGFGRHEAMLRTAMQAHLPDIPVIGCVQRQAGLVHPSRHLGLVQARERPDLDRFIADAAAAVAQGCDLESLRGIARPGGGTGTGVPSIPPLGQHIAIARDDAFAFLYPHLCDGWRAAGAELSFFSPLADERPAGTADAIYLPGGYPELHAGRIAGNRSFRDGLRAAADRGAAIFGECGGYMVLGTGLVDADGVRHAMAGLLPVVTSFQTPRLHLGYRHAILNGAGAPWPAGTRFAGHEFHYAATLEEGAETPLFEVSDATGQDLGAAGQVVGRVAGSFLHLIDIVP